MAKLALHGAIAGVTGSAYLLKTGTARVLLECSLYQGARSEEAANQQALYNPAPMA